ncbi:MAG TPA: metal ABC transporter substrate-binding protein [Thermomicrobiales bacterium]|nr:metal ABC transporter substrate-binding protein [Thermomicrobiales bacterium]
MMPKVGGLAPAKRGGQMMASAWLIALACDVIAWLPAAAQSTPAATAIVGPHFVMLPVAAPRDGGPLAVVTTTPLLADLVHEVGGDRVTVQSILPPNADPHDYEPKPADLVDIEDADVIVEHGLNLDHWADALVANAGASAPVLVATHGVPTIASNEAGFGGGDPHVWFDPTNVKIMTDTIAAALTNADPAGAASYAARRDAYDRNLGILDAWIKGQIATIPPKRRKLVTNHDAFTYYVTRYGLTDVGSVIPSLDTSAEPSAQETEALIGKIKAEGVPAIFTEASLNPRLEQQLAADAGVAVVPTLYGDTLGSPGTPGDTYLGMMVADTTMIVDALR